MATFKTIVRYKRADGFYQVYIRVLHRSKSGYIKTDKFVTDKQASSFAELCSLIILSIHILRKMDRNVYGLNWQFNKNIFHHVCRISIWSMFNPFIGVASWFAFFVAIEHLGELELAATNVIRSISTLFLLLSIHWQQQPAHW